MAQKTITREELKEVIGSISECTLKLYLSNWRLTPYEQVRKCGRNIYYSYPYSKAFFDTLYSYLIDRNRLVWAKNLREEIESEDMKIEYDGFKDFR